EATRAIVADPALDGVRVLVLTTFDEDEHVHEAIRAGAAGDLLKDIAPDALREAIRTVAAGDALLSAAVTAAVMRAAVDGGALPADRRPLEHLTERELEGLTLIGRGRTDAELACEPVLRPAPSRTHVSRPLAMPG